MLILQKRNCDWFYFTVFVMILLLKKIVIDFILFLFLFYIPTYLLEKTIVNVSKEYSNRYNVLLSKILCNELR